MPRSRNRLTVRQLQTLGAGYHADGGGLYLQVTASGARSWVFRFSRAGRAREMGLGPLAVVGLAEARQRALDARQQLLDGLDPIEARRTARVASTPRTWGHAVDEFIARREPTWKGPAQAHQWRQSLADHGPPRDLPLAGITTPVVLACLTPLWRRRDQGGLPETASRVRGRIERVWDAERVAGHASGENPARWNGHLEALLPRITPLKRVQHQSAMPFAELPAFYQSLAARDGLTRRALRFLILTAARTSEVTGMPDLREIDRKARLWTIPAARMKSGREHIVPLSSEALACLEGLPVGKPPFALSENTMLALVQRSAPKGYGLPYTVHGFRSSFRDWAAETTHTPNHIVEMALAHAIRDKAEAAYRRGQLLEHRRALMEAWAGFVTAATSARQRAEPGWRGVAER